MRHTASDIPELKHWFANQFIIRSNGTVFRSEHVTGEGKCGNLRYELMRLDEFLHKHSCACSRYRALQFQQHLLHLLLQVKEAASLNSSF